MIHITLRLLSGPVPFELELPYTAEHLREEIVTGELDLALEWEGKGVEYVSLYDVDGRCLLDDDMVKDEEEYMLFIHTQPIQRFYLEETDKVLELEVSEDPTVQEVYDVLVEALWKEQEQEQGQGQEQGQEQGQGQEQEQEQELRISLRVGGMSLLGWDEDEPLTGRELVVEMLEREHPWEWE